MTELYPEGTFEDVDPDAPPIPDMSSRSDDEKDIAAEMGFAFIASVLGAKALGIWPKLGERFSSHGYDQKTLWDEVGERYIEAMAGRLAGPLIKANQIGYFLAARELDTPYTQADWMKITEPWAKVYANEVATQSWDQSAEAVQQSVVQYVNSGLRGATLGDRLKDLFGMDPRSAKTWIVYSSQKDRPTTVPLTDKAAMLVAQRAKTIGDVQTFTAMNFGRQLVYMQAIQDGRMPADAKKVWVTAIDERVCEICAPMDGRAVGVMDGFTIVLPKPKTARGQWRKSLELLVPPVHPNCRCTTVPEGLYRQGLITRRARFSDSGPPAHRARISADYRDLIHEVSVGKRFDPREKRDQAGKWVKGNPWTATVGALAGILAGTATGVTGHEQFKRERTIRRNRADWATYGLSKEKAEEFTNSIRPNPYDPPTHDSELLRGYDASTLHPNPNVWEEANQASNGFFPGMGVRPDFPNITAEMKPEPRTLYRAMDFAAWDPEGAENFRKFWHAITQEGELDIPHTNWSSEGHQIVTGYGHMYPDSRIPQDRKGLLARAPATGERLSRTVILEAPPNSIPAFLLWAPTREQRHSGGGYDYSNYLAKGKMKVDHIHVVAGTAEDPRIVKVVLAAAEAVHKSWREDEHPRNHGKFSHVAGATAATIGGAALAVGAVKFGPRYLTHVIPDAHLASAVNMSRPMSHMPGAWLQNKGGLKAAEAFGALPKGSAPKNPYRFADTLAADFHPGEQLFYRPQAYKHLQGKNYEETRERIERFLQPQEVEHAFVVTPSGKIISGSRGNDMQAPLFVPSSFARRGNNLLTMLHNHPNPEIDASLSAQDAVMFSHHGIGRLRAVTRNGVTYEMGFKDVPKEQAADFTQRATEAALDGHEEAVTSRLLADGHSEDDIMDAQIALSEEQQYQQDPAVYREMWGEDYVPEMSDEQRHLANKYKTYSIAHQSERTDRFFQQEAGAAESPVTYYHSSAPVQKFWDPDKHPRAATGQFVGGRANPANIPGKVALSRDMDKFTGKYSHKSKTGGYFPHLVGDQLDTRRIAVAMTPSSIPLYRGERRDADTVIPEIGESVNFDKPRHFTTAPELAASYGQAGKDKISLIWHAPAGTKSIKTAQRKTHQEHGVSGKFTVSNVVHEHDSEGNHWVHVHLRPKREVTLPRDAQGRFDLHPAKVDADVKRWLTDEHDGGSVGTGLAHIRTSYENKATRTALGRLYDKRAEAAPHPLYRGFSTSRDIKDGQIMRMQMTSWTSEEKVAQDFATMRNGQNGGQPTVIRVLPGAVGLDISPLYNYKTDTFRTHRRKKEWILQGRYRVLASHVTKDGVRYVDVQQVKTTAPGQSAERKAG